MPFLVLDLEMTGGDPGWHEIIQIGAVLYNDNWTELGQYLTNVYPENEESISDYAEEIHGLSLIDLDDAPMMHDVLPEFEDWIIDKLHLRKMKREGQDNGHLLRDVIICGQSVINDINFLRFAYNDQDRKWVFSNKLLDTHTLGYFVFRILKNNGQKVPEKLSLTAIASHFGFQREGKQHNALEDAILTGKCFMEIYKIADKLKLS